MKPPKFWQQAYRLEPRNSALWTPEPSIPLPLDPHLYHPLEPPPHPQPTGPQPHQPPRSPTPQPSGACPQTTTTTTGISPGSSPPRPPTPLPLSSDLCTVLLLSSRPPSLIEFHSKDNEIILKI